MSSSEVSVFICYLTPVPGTRVILGGVSVYTLPDTCTRYLCHPRRVVVVSPGMSACCQSLSGPLHLVSFGDLIRE